MNKRASRIPWKSGKCDFNVKRLTRLRIFHGRVSNDRTLDGPQLLLPFCYVRLCCIRSWLADVARRIYYELRGGSDYFEWELI